MLGSILTVKKRSERKIPYCHVNLHKAPTGRVTKTCLSSPSLPKFKISEFNPKYETLLQKEFINYFYIFKFTQLKNKLGHDNKEV